MQQLGLLVCNNKNIIYLRNIVLFIGKNNFLNVLLMHTHTHIYKYFF